MSISLKKILVTAILLLATVSSCALASTDFSLCRQLFAAGAPPVLNNQSMAPRALCYDSFAVLHSGKSRTPIYVAERLNKDGLENKITRGTRFFADARLPSGERAELADYKQSGFDRGHMAPAGDMATDAAMAQSFSLANMVPQAMINNRKPWAAIEKATRQYVLRASGDVYVITGPVFDARPATIGQNRVWVPQSLFKLVYDPAMRRSWVHWLDNNDDARVGKPITYEELVRRTGIDFMPAIGR